jgi:hypothetical protein
MASEWGVWNTMDAEGTWTVCLASAIRYGAESPGAVSRGQGQVAGQSGKDICGRIKLSALYKNIAVVFASLPRSRVFVAMDCSC